MALSRSKATWLLGLSLLSCALRANDPDGTTPLHYAVRRQDVAAVRQMLAQHVPCDAANRYGVTPLTLAVEQGNLEIVQALIAAGADVNHALPEGETVLMTAARTGNVAVLQALLKKDARAEARDGFYGETALIWATDADHADAVTALLDAGVGVDTRSASAQFARRNAGLTRLSLGEWTPLMYAARDGAMKAGAILIERGAQVNAADPDGATALVLAIINYHYDFAALLLDHGADPNLADTTGMAALFAAVDMHSLPWMFGRPENPAPSKVTALELIEMLLKRGAHPNAALTAVQFQRAHTDGDGALGVGATPFHRASKAADVPVMKLLLAHGADAKAVMKNGNNALMLAAGLGYRDGNMAVPTKDRGTPEDAIAAIQLCLDQGLNINAPGNNGDTPLHVAINGREGVEVARYLVAHGADIAAKNARGLTPIEAAKASRKDRSDIVKLLSGR
ncbi:MAG TPA: ankyrin repeat domain-containing protein [Bryobacteraceae bacterium]|jgi:ankyrin repeat protein